MDPMTDTVGGASNSAAMWSATRVISRSNEPIRSSARSSSPNAPATIRSWSSHVPTKGNSAVGATPLYCS